MANRHQLPPLAAIRAFEAAARHRNFSRAAAELAMTQAAVSYQIKVLEERVGTTLFNRHAKGVSLTPIGDRLFRQSRQSLDILRDAYAEARGEDQQTLTVSVVPTFAMTILTQRLDRFQSRHPEIGVRLSMNHDAGDLVSSDIDVGIHCGLGNQPGISAQMLFNLAFTPMLSPALAATIGGVKRPGDLLKLPVIEASDPWWRIWLDAAGLKGVEIPNNLNLRSGSQIFEARAAIAGQGVGILTPAFYAEEVANGQLIQPFDLVCELPEGYYFQCLESRRNSRKIRLFRDWIMAEMKDFAAPRTNPAS